MKPVELLRTLLGSDEPAIRWKTRVHVLGEDPESHALRELQAEIKASPRVRTLLARFDAHGDLPGTSGPYAQWQGGHWVLVHLRRSPLPDHHRADTAA